MSRPGAAVPARRPWADLRDDSLDNLQDDSLPPAPLHEDSYVRRDTDLSIDAGNLGLQPTQAASQPASMAVSQPASFEMNTDSEFGFPVRRAQEALASRSMNPDAQEFHPAVGPPGQPGASASPPAVVVPVVVLPVVAEQAGAAPAPEPSRRRITRKRQAAPGRGGTPSAARRRMDGIEEPPRSLVPPAAPDGPGQEPVATEEDWVRRCGKRRDIIATIKASPDYTERGQAAPGTPDPDDRNVSKRAWEDVIRGWRQGLRQSAQ